MDIMNNISDHRYEEVDDLLAFVSIYDDKNRTKAYKKMLKNNKDKIIGKVCVEAGCGFGIFSEYLAQLGASKVYAVERNPLLFEQAKQRLTKYSNIELVQSDIRDFSPDVPVNVLVHELFGQLLYDEDLFALEGLLFSPTHFFPNKAILTGGCIDSQQLVDETVTTNVLKQLDGCLVSGLFDENGLDLDFPVMSWEPANSRFSGKVDISNRTGDLLYFGLQIFHDDELICTAGPCDNWSFVWTPRTVDQFTLEFKRAERGMDVFFTWQK